MTDSNKKKLNIEFKDDTILVGQAYADANDLYVDLNLNNEVIAYIVGCMAINAWRLRKHIEGQYELHRYCVKAGITVIGGASKLFKAFEREIDEMNDRINELQNQQDYPPEVFQWFIVGENGADIIKEYTDDPLYYNEELDMYLWWIILLIL